MADSKEDWKRKDEGEDEEDEEVDESVCQPNYNKLVLI